MNRVQHALVPIENFSSPSEEVVRQMADTLCRWTLFSPEIYRRNNGDIAHFSNEQIYEHFARFGLWEGRTFQTATHVARSLASVDARSHTSPEVIQLPTGLPAVTVFVSSLGNSFMKEIKDEIAMQLSAVGCRVQEADENSDPSSLTGIPVVIAPHEFFILGNGKKWRTNGFISRAVMVSTEQPQTSWFRISLPFLLRCKAVIELCYQCSVLLQEAGKPSFFYMPAFNASTPDFRECEIVNTPIIQALPKAAFEFDPAKDSFLSRPIDIAFFGSDSPFRDKFFAHAASRLAAHSQIILYRRSQGSPKPYGSHEQVARINNFTLQRSKILLNIHRDALGYFEIHRIGVMGFLNRTLVVSDPCIPHPLFKPGEHYLEESTGRIPKLIDWILTTNEGRDLAEKIRSNAFITYRNSVSLKKQATKLANFLSEINGGPNG